MGSELSSEEELYIDLMNNPVMCKADVNEAALPSEKENIALLKNEIERISKPKTFYD
jgi:hypothetical protein